MLKTRLLAKCGSTFLLGLISLNSSAALIDHNSYFTDTNTGLSWLDVTATVNRSFNDVSSQFGVGGEFEGWRYATGVEFNALLYSWTGVSPSPIQGTRTITTGTSPSVDGLINLFGSTLDSWYVNSFGQTWDARNGYAEGQGIDFTLGILADTFQNDNGQRKVAGIWDNELSNSAIDFYNTDHRHLKVGDYLPEIGSFLVRGVQPIAGGNGSGGQSPDDSVARVSEPQSILLFAAGLLALFIRRKHY